MHPISTNTPRDRGLWSDYRANDARTGMQHVALRGPLVEKWSLHLGGGFQEMLPVGDGTTDIIMCDAGGVQRLTIDAEMLWATKPFGAHGITGVYDLDGDGRLEIVTTNGTELLLLDANTGEALWRRSMIDFDRFRSYGTYAGMIQAHRFYGRGMQLVVPAFVNSDLLLFDCSEGAENTRLAHVLEGTDAFHPTIAIGDVNRDGIDEIVVARLGGVYVFDPITGCRISETLWESDETRRRNYGHFELADIDGDGDLEAIILGDRVSRHMAVLDNDGTGLFSPLWDRFIQHIYPTDTTELRYVTNSLSPLDRGGRHYITVGIYNERGDDRWYTEVLDPATGTAIATFEDCYLRGITDANADGIPELCLSRETERMPQQFAPLLVTSLEHGVLWSGINGAFAERKIYPSATRGEFKPDVFHPLDIWNTTIHGAQALPLFARSGETTELALLTSALEHVVIDTRFDTLPRIAHAVDGVVFVSEANGRVSRIDSSGAAHWRSCGYHLTTEAHSAARPAPQATVVERDEVRYLVVPTFSGEINIYRASTEATIPALHATITARSKIGYDNTYHSVSTIDYRGEPLLVVVDDADLPHSRVSLFDLEGRRVKSFVFGDMPPSRAGARIGAYEWLPFEHSRGAALMISFFQSQSMNSETSLAVLLETGEILWRAEHVGEGEYGRGLGPWSAIARQGDRALLCAKDLLVTLDLETGAVVGEPHNLTHYTADAMRAAGTYREQDYTTWSSIEDPFTAYGTPIVIGSDVLVSGCFGGMGLLREGHARWWHVTSFGDVLYKLPGIGDLDGDGRIEFAQPHADGLLSIHDLETGELRWVMDVGGIGSDVTSCDMNGDGRMNFVLGTNDGRVLLIGWEDNILKVVAEHQLAASAGSPIVADLDGDGTSEVYIVTADGNLTCFSHS